MKKIIALLLVIALTAGISIAGTTAYLQSEDSDVNVMTLGNVKIDQIEQERDENGNLDNFTQAKPAFPAVGPVEWAGTGVNVNGTEYKVFTDELKNVVDKIVTVENTGKSPAYVRTVIAIEAPDYDPNDLIHINYNDTGVSISEPVKVEVGGVEYVCFAFTYDAALAPGQTSAPSLMQVFLDSKATNEDVAKFGDTWEILVVSQAVQTQGFADAETALDTAFGKPSEKAAEWFGDIKTPILVRNVNDMREAMKIPGVKMILGEDVEITDDKGTGYCLYAKYDCEIDLNGYDLKVDLSGKDFYGVVNALKGAKVDIVGEGNIEINGGVGPFVWCSGGNQNAPDGTEVNIYGGNWTQNSADFSGSNFTEGVYANRAGIVNIYGGIFNWNNFQKYTVNESRGGVINIYGGTFINFDPRVSHDSDGSYVAEGYTVISETQSNGDIWYTVVKA